MQYLVSRTYEAQKKKIIWLILTTGNNKNRNIGSPIIGIIKQKVECKRLANTKTVQFKAPMQNKQTKKA